MRKFNQEKCNLQHIQAIHTCTYSGDYRVSILETKASMIDTV